MKQPILAGISARDIAGSNPFSDPPTGGAGLGDSNERSEPTSVDDELAAMDTVLHVLEGLDPAAQRRALTWVADRLGVPLTPVYPIGAVPRDPFIPR